MAEDYLIIRGKKIHTKSVRLPVNELRFFAENPRIYSAIGADQAEPSQEEIQTKLVSMDHVKELIQDIKLNGDLLEPIYVKDGTFEVLEGNSRLAAYRELVKQDPIKWGKMRSLLLPSDIDEASIFSLLGQYHIKGKKDWLPFEQAGFLHRRHTRQNVELQVLATELGLKSADAKNLVSTYDFMIEHKVRTPSKWSYFYEYIKSRKVKKYRQQFSDMDKLVVDQIKKEQVGKAMDFRSGLKLLGDAKPQVIKKFMSEDYTFEDAVSAAESSGNANEIFKRLNRFRTWITKHEIQSEIESSQGDVGNKIRYELHKLHGIFKKWEQKN